MVKFLIIFFIIILIEILVIGLIFSRIVLNVENCNIYSNGKKIKDIKIDKMQIYLSVYLFKVFKIINIRFYKDYFKLNGLKIYYEKVFIIKKDTFKKSFKVLKNIIFNREIETKKIKPEMKFFYMNLSFCSENAAFTAVFLSTISSITSLFLNNFIKEFSYEKYYYKINPIYLNTNGFKFELKTELDFNSFNIIEFILNYKSIRKIRIIPNLNIESQHINNSTKALKKLFNKKKEYSKINF